jgi:4-amino-4-deoxy-L-arabinose transferase-like glycosyltransferase
MTLRRTRTSLLASIPPSLWAASLAFVVLNVLLVLLRYGLWSHDTGYFVWIAGELLQGALLYRDVPAYTPLAYWLTAVAVLLFGANEVAELFLALVIFPLFCVVVVILGAFFYGRSVGIAAGVLFTIALHSPSIGGYGAAIDADLLALFLSSIGVWLALQFTRSRSWWMLVSAGGVFGLALLSKQIAVAPLAVTVAYLLAIGIAQPGTRFRAVLAGGTLVLVAILPVLALALFMVVAGAFEEMVYRLLVWPRLAHPADPAALVRAVSVIAPRAGAIWLLAGVGAALVVRDVVTSRRAVPGLLLVGWMVAAAAILLGAQFGQYFLHVALPASILAGLGLIESFNRSRRLLSERARLVVSSGTALVFALTLALNFKDAVDWRRPGVYVHLARQHALADYMRLNSTTDDTILAFPFEPEFYVFAERDPAVYTPAFYSSNIGTEIPGEAAAFCQALTTRRPKFVIVRTDQIASMTSRPEQDVLGCIRENYVEALTDGPFAILGRR